MLPKYDYDVIGVGFGPANIALAIGLAELENKMSCLFLEKNKGPSWQSNMLLPHSDIQNHPLRDLVTPRNPRSRFTFTNFLHEKGRLFEHLNLGMKFPFRTEYEQYVKWVAECFDDIVNYNAEVTEIRAVLDEHNSVPHYRVMTRGNECFTAKNIVVAPGRTPYIPMVFQDHKDDRITHFTHYLPVLNRLNNSRELKHIVVVGGSQSAVEIALHLSDELPLTNISLVTRNYGLRMKDASPFTGEVYFPEFVNRFFSADSNEKERLKRELHHTNYSSSDVDVLDELYQKMYLQKINGEQRLKLVNRAEIDSINRNESDITLNIISKHPNEMMRLQADFVICATGFTDLGVGEGKETHPNILDGLVSNFDFNDEGFLDVNLDYSLKPNKRSHSLGMCFLNGLCESSHGMGDAGSFSLLSLRAKSIISAIINNDMPARGFSENLIKIG